MRLENDRERSRSNRTNELEEQRQIRLGKKRDQIRSSRTNETEQQRQIRLEQNREQTRSGRGDETEEQQQVRLDQQKKRSQTNRKNKKLVKQKHLTIGIEQDAEIRLSMRSVWPEPVPRDLKETRLQDFLQQMSMSVLAEITCAVCNIRVPAKDSKKIPFSKIPNINLLKVGEELDRLLKSSNKDIGITISDNSMMMQPTDSNI
jgi:hypothetical protein